MTFVKSHASNSTLRIFSALCAALVVSSIICCPNSARASEPPAAGSDKNIEVVLTLPMLSPPIYNALATWDPVRQEACLYSATSLRSQPKPSDAWVTPGDCTIWKPNASYSPGVYDINWERGESHAPLIISSSPVAKTKAKTVVIVPDYTWQAYNIQSGGNFYFQNGKKKRGEDYSAGVLSLLRPNNFVRVGDPVDWPTVTQEFPGVNPIAFLRESLGEVDVIQQSLLDTQHYDLKEYKTIVVYGHDEYWTERVRYGIEHAVQQGSNLLNLSGNTGYRHIIRDGETIHFETPTSQHPNTSLWGEATGTTSPAKLLGAMYLGRPFNLNKSSPIAINDAQYARLLKFGLPSSTPKNRASTFLQGLRVTKGESPIFDGTGLRTGDWFGFGHKAIGYEVDGLPENADGSPSGGAIETFGKNLPESVAETWLHPYGKTGEKLSRTGMLTMSQFGLGHVFSAGSVGWTAALVAGDREVRQVTLNAYRLINQR